MKVRPDFAAIEQHVTAHVEPHYQKLCAKMLGGEASSFAQAWQDWYIWHNVFRGDGTLTWGQGMYVEVGVWHPLRLSNTLFFDKCLGWGGVCFEPNPRWWPLIKGGAR